MAAIEMVKAAYAALGKNEAEGNPLADRGRD